MRDRVNTVHAKLARLMDWRKSAPFISTEMHISASLNKLAGGRMVITPR